MRRENIRFGKRAKNKEEQYDIGEEEKVNKKKGARNKREQKREIKIV